MTVLILAGSIAKYVGKAKAWEHRRMKKCVVQEDTSAASVLYSVKFEDEDKVVRAQYGSLEFLQKNMVELEPFAVPA